MTIQDILQKQDLPYKAKVAHAELRAREFYDTIVGQMYNANCHVSVGGLDSITLYLFLQSICINVPGISVSSVEDKSIQRIHKALGILTVKPLKSKAKVIQEYGFPVISKNSAEKISSLQNINAKESRIIAIMTGKTSKRQYSRKTKLPDKWLKLFAGHHSEIRPNLVCKIAPFKVSDRCCYWLKEKPCRDWGKERNSYPYLGLMASEGGQRELGLIKNGCNYYSKSDTRSCPFAIFTRQDILQLAIDLKVPVPEIYGEIKRKPDGTLYTTRAQRSGCSMCGFGIHIEKRPHRFDRLKEDNPKEWAYWMYDVGWGQVLDWIGVEWEGPPGAMRGQLSLDDVM